MTTLIEYNEQEADEQIERLKNYEHFKHLDVVKIEVRAGAYNVKLVQRAD